MDTAHPQVAVSSWRWFHIYHWILALHHGRFVKYNRTLHQNLLAHDLIGSQLMTLTRCDWLSLGVSDLGDIQILLDEVARLKSQISPSPKSSNSSDSDNFRESDQQTLNAMSPIPKCEMAHDANSSENGEATLNSLLYHNHLRQTALSQQCRTLYVYAVNVTAQLSAERSHRMMAEQALAEQAIQTQALREALSRCQSSATTVQATMAQMTADTKALERELCEKMNAAEKLSAAHRELKGQFCELKALSDAKRKSVRLWSVDECFVWMANLENGRFGRAYEDLYERLEVENVHGAELSRMGVEDMERLGIEDGCDQRRLLAHIRILMKEERAESEEDDYDFADLELLSASWGTDSL